MKRLFGLMVLVMLVVLAAPPSYAVPITFIAHLTGPSEAPPNASPGIGDALVELDTVAHTLSVSATFSGLIGTTTRAHIHCCTALPGTGTAGVATEDPSFPGFPIGVTSGTYLLHTFDTTMASTFLPAFITAHGGTPAGAEAFLAAGLLVGEAYFNIHTTVVPGGEIRGFLQAVPEPGTFGLLAIGITALGVVVRRRRG